MDKLYTPELESGAVQRAADIVAEMEWDGDEEDHRDGANLIVNLTMGFLANPSTSTLEVIYGNYDHNTADYLAARLPEAERSPGAHGTDQ